MLIGQQESASVVATPNFVQVVFLEKKKVPHGTSTTAITCFSCAKSVITVL